MFMSYHGSGYSGSPKYLTEYLLGSSSNNTEIIWAFKNPHSAELNISKKIRKVRYKSLIYIYYAMTSRVRVTNAEEWIVLPKRKIQTLINTWHGTTYKKIAYADPYVRSKLGNFDYYGKTDIFISPCDQTSIFGYRESLRFRGKILECGLPRNDIFFKTDMESEVHRIKQTFGYDSTIKIVLYAPTFREQKHNEFTPLQGQMVTDSLQRKFGGKWILFYRGHSAAEAGIGVQSFTNCLGEYVNSSTYPDMQELLLISDVLITDYSSSIWDYSLTYKPCFLYAPDIHHYCDKERGFYSDIRSWGFSVSENMLELHHHIDSFDANKYKEIIRIHHTEFGSFESGNASKIVCRFIINCIYK
jgi:CDP-glycerol glycerophosphotransferase